MAVTVRVVDLCVIAILYVISTSTSVRSVRIHLDSPTLRYKRQSISYDEEFPSTVTFSENTPLSTVLFDFKSENIAGQAASSFTYRIVNNKDSKPPKSDFIFRIDNQQVKFAIGLSEEDRKKNFDYEQYPTVGIIVEAVHNSDVQENDKKLIKLSIPLSDVNDELPVLENKPSPYLAAVPVRPNEGDTVYELLAEDPDSNADIVYSIDRTKASADVLRLFRMDMVKEGSGDNQVVVGHIKVATRSEFVQGEEYTIPVKITDQNGVYPQEISANVEVLVGPRVPQFYEKNYRGSIFETEKSNNPIVYTGDDSSKELIVKVQSFQGNFPKTFRILEDNTDDDSKQFRIDEKGHIFNKESLDYDATQRPPVYQLRIKVTEALADGTTLFNLVPLEIEVKDENDNAPRFRLTQYLKTISEDTPIGETVLTVLAEDADSGKNAEVNYELDNKYFAIEKVIKNGQTVGAITVKENLDYDALPGPIYRFSVKALDNGAPPLSSAVDVIITTSNVNDQSPVIQEQKSLVLRDGVDVSKQPYYLTRMRAQDADGDGVQFYLASTTGQKVTQLNIFRIIPSSGVIEVYQPVPPNIDSYTLEVIAQDDGQCCTGSTNQKESRISFVVEIVDSVNQKPSFDNCLSYTGLASVKEESDAGTPVITVSATDDGRGPNGIVRYTIISPNPTVNNAPFTIDRTTGEITVKSKIDREAENSNFIQVTVKGTDEGEFPQEGWCTFRVEIQDINDNNPVFNTDLYTQEVSSKTQLGKVLLRIGAVDKDIGLNSELTYSLQNNDDGVFGIYNETGLIYLKKSFTAGLKYTLIAKAEDKGSPKRNATAQVVFTVKNQEDIEPPIFENGSREFKVAETAPINHAIANFKCQSNTDKDSRVQFFLVDEDGDLRTRQVGKFSIDTSNKEATLRVAESLDFEKQQQHTVTLRCQNLLKHTMYEQISLKINVQDRNDEVPAFPGWIKNGRYSASVLENEEPGFAFINIIQADDADISSQYNQLSYEISPDSYDGVENDFAIRTLEGNKAEIRTLKKFDREKLVDYLLIIVANDKTPSDIPTHKPPGTPNTASVALVVSIADVNDNAMTFKQDLYEHSVKETANIGSVIFAVTADDLDEVDSGKLYYSFIEDNIPFDIRDRTGEIFVTGKLDYESDNKDYLLTLMSRDSANRFSASTMVKLTLTDENDNVPIFSPQEYEVNNVTEEDESINRDNALPLVKVYATDKDISRTKKIRYQLLGEGTETGPGQLFTIDQGTGQIYLITKLDRDKPLGKAEYIFTVEALDEEVNPQRGYANVKVFPKDINDNKPVFDRNSLMDTIPEHSPVDQFVAQVKATDADAGINQELFYDIVKSHATTDDLKMNYFRIEPTGQIFSQVDKSFLDRDTKPQLEVIVRATDKGNPPQSATATLIIKLSDINDNAPIFVEKNYQVSFSESRESGVILEVQATDKDINENALLTFSIEDNSHFKIDTINNKGYISIKFPVDYEVVSQQHFLLNIYVTDKDPLHKDTATVNITVEDFNDEEPVFVNTFAKVDIKENESPGKNITTFTAYDKDSGINGQLSYTIERKSDPRREFYIEPDTGVVWTRKSLDREKQSRMEVKILAIDKGDPQKTGTATMEVIITDVNDNFPVFLKDYRPVVMENGGRSDLPLEIFAKDPDSTLFGPPFGFALPPACNNTACQRFSLDFKPNGDGGKGTAVVSTTLTFDREQQKYYELPIVMWDMRGLSNPNAQTGTNTLTITIGDKNDNQHFPGHQDVFVYNYKGTFGPLVIGRVYVEDKDDWDLPDKNFTYVSPASLNSYFKVDLGTGDITMMKGVTANSADEPYMFSVSVYDRHFKREVVSTVAVTVQDLTEEAVANSGGVKFKGITASAFILEPTDPRTGVKQESLYTKFRKLMAGKLGYPLQNVEIINLRDTPDGSLVVRYSAHGSPYLSPAEMDNVVVMNQAEFEALGLTVGEVPIDECQDEIFEGGCYNKLTITGKPVTVNANGTSYVGVEAYMVATQGCEADVFPASNECTGDYCHNGGECYKDDWLSLKCRNCPAGYTGSRCQEMRHSFDGNSVATYKTLTQCEDSQTSIEFITKKDNGVIFYNGPLLTVDTQSDQPVDFILLKLNAGFPELHIDHGTGVAVLTLDGKDSKGQQLLQKLNDGVWHHIDINRKGKKVELVVDRCAVAEVSSQVVADDRACRVVMETPGVNLFLNVNSLLQLGGVRLLEPSVSHLAGIVLDGFDGCLRNLVHNKQLYDLHYKEISGVNTGKNGCPREDAFCLPPGQPAKCGANGECEATLDGAAKCTCHSGYWGRTCNNKATISEYKEESYYLWEMKSEFFNRLTRNRDISVHIMFRTRQRDGVLMVLEDTSSSPNTQHIKLMLYQGILRLTYNLGGGDKILDMVNAVANNGQWHTLTMERYGTEFHLKLDNGEGRNYAYRLASQDAKERAVFKVNRRVYSGGYKQSSDDLINSCVQDVRINNGYFAMKMDKQSDPYTVAVVDENPNTEVGRCTRDDCAGDKCRMQPNTVCVPLWEDFQCRCKPGYHGPSCLHQCVPNPCFNNVTCLRLDADFECQCPARWRGKLCNKLGPEEVVSSDMSGAALIAIVVSIIIVILVALLIFLLYFKLFRNTDDGEKYILEVDPEDDIRENVMNYDEEGAGEKDQDAYDISRLQPLGETLNRPYDPDMRRHVPLKNAPGERPDVGNFIDDRMRDADDDDGAPPHDSVREFNFEGGDSDAGSLSSLNTSSSDRSQDYDYLNEWGPKFSKLADMYGAGQDLPSS